MSPAWVTAEAHTTQEAWVHRRLLRTGGYGVRAVRPGGPTGGIGDRSDEGQHRPVWPHAGVSHTGRRLGLFSRGGTGWRGEVICRRSCNPLRRNRSRRETGARRPTRIVGFTMSWRHSLRTAVRISTAAMAAAIRGVNRRACAENHRRLPYRCRQHERPQPFRIAHSH